LGADSRSRIRPVSRGCAIQAGFGSGTTGEDQFDALAGLLGMLDVLLSEGNALEPSEYSLRHIEGWIFGLK
jgi:hypothetical protein